MVTPRQNIAVPRTSAVLPLPWYWMQRSFAAPPATYLEQPGKVKLWSQRIVSCWSIQGDAGTGICSLSSWTLLRIQGSWLCNKMPLYTALSSSYFNFWCKYRFISNSFCCQFSLVYVSFKIATCFEASSSLLNHLERASSSRMSSSRAALKSLHRALQLLLHVSIS